MAHRRLDAANSPAGNPEDRLRGFPPQVTSFVGRTQEISDITALIADPHCRLVTLVGPGGIGKTRLALEIARRLDFADGIYYVPLQALRSGEHVLSSLANALDFQALSGVNLHQQLEGFLSGKQLLLVLDNFEYVLEAAGFISAILADASMVKALATSREPLNLQEEWVRRLRGLAYPENDASIPLVTYDAVQLFVERAQQQRGDFHVEDEAEHVVRICRLVDGLPLALELAAGWSRTLSCAAIAAEIQRRIDFLTTNARNMPERHRSMRAVFDHSWSLLSREEAQVMRGFTVFRGGCAREAAEAVLGASLDMLSRLVDKSLLHHSAGRYEVQELQRQYAEEQLDASGEGEQIRDRHCHYYGALCYARRSDQFGPGKADFLRMLTIELDNIRASWAWALQREDYEIIDQLVEFLWMYYTDYSMAFELGALCQVASERLAACDGPRERAILGRVLARLGKWEVTYSHLERAEALLRQSMAIAREQGDLEEYYQALRWLARFVLFYTGCELSVVRQMLEECVAFYRERGDKAYLALSLSNLGAICRSMGDIEQGLRCLLQCYQLNREMDYPYGTAKALTRLGCHSMQQGRWVEAEQRLSESVEMQRQCGDRRGLIYELPELSRVAVMQGDFARAEQLCEAALALRTAPDPVVEPDVAATVVCGCSRSLIADASGASSDALRMIEESLALVAQLAPADRRWRHLVHSWVLCSLEAFDQASGTFSALFSSARQIYWGAAYRLFAIATYARILAHRGEVLRAVELLGLVFNHPNGPQGYLKKHQGMTHLRAELEAELGTEVYAAAWERGQSLDVDTVFTDLVDEFLPEDMPENDLRLSAHTRAANRALPEPLTPRELEILHLITQGLSNDEIASDLVVSVTTVKKHISHIYGKLNVQRRAQAITWAQERQFFQ
jgi:predicted ATPase/DNA-binding CsgD family transcriptional regulator